MCFSDEVDATCFAAPLPPPQLREEMNATGREVNLHVTDVKLGHCRRQLEKLKKEAQQQLQQQQASTGPAAAETARSLEAIRRVAVEEANVALLGETLESLPALLTALAATSSDLARLLDLNALATDARPVKPVGAAQRGAVGRLVHALGVLVRCLKEGDGLVRRYVQVEMQVAEVEAGNWNKLVPPVGAKEGREGKGAGVGMGVKAGREQGRELVAAAMQEKGRQGGRKHKR